MDNPNNQRTSDSYTSAIGSAVVFGGIALALGAGSAFRSGNLFPGIRNKIHPFQIEAGRLATKAMRSASNEDPNSENIWGGGLLKELGDTDTLSKSDLRGVLRETIKSRYSSSGTEGEITVKKLLNSIVSKERELADGEMGYQSTLGFSIKSAHIDLLKKHRSGPDGLISDDTLISNEIFTSSKDNLAYNKAGLNMAKNFMLGFDIPAVGNPLDVVLREEAPLVQRIPLRSMMLDESIAEEGAVVGGKLYAINSKGESEFIKNKTLVRADSSAGRAARRMNPRYDRSFEEEEKRNNARELGTQGYYDSPFLEKILDTAKKVPLFPKSLMDQSFVQNLDRTNRTITEQIDKFFSETPLLKNFSSRYRTNTTYAKDFIQDPIENSLNKTKLYPTDSDAAKRKPNILEKTLNKFYSAPGGEKKYISLNEQEAADFYSEKARRTNRSALNRERDPHAISNRMEIGLLTPNAVDRSYQTSVGSLHSDIMPNFMMVDDTVGANLNLRAMQALNTSLDILEKTTGIGVKGMDPVSLVGLAIGASVAANIVSEALSFFDYMLEKANPFGDVGIKKASIYLYAAGRTAQQKVLEQMSPLFALNEEFAPGSTDSPLGHVVRMAAGALIGSRIGKGMAVHKGVAGALALGLPTIGKSSEDLWDEYMGDKLVDVRESRFWGLGPQDWRGGDVKFQRKSLIAMELDDSRYDHFGGKGSYFLNSSVLSLPGRMVGGITGIGNLTGIEGLDPYAIEKKNYYNNEFPVTGGMFDNTPIIGAMLSATLGQVFKPTQLMHQDAVRDYYMTPEADEIGDIARSMGIDVPNKYPSMARLSTFSDSVGNSMDNLMDLFGMRGFMASSAKGVLTGNSSFVAKDKILETSSVMNSVAGRFYENELGGMLMQSEFPRRLLSGNKMGDQSNPLDPKRKNKFSTFNKIQQRIGDPRSFGGTIGTAFNPGSGDTVDALYGWNMKGSLKDNVGIPYLFGKAYSNKDPLEYYRKNVSHSDDYNDWQKPYATILDPYMENMKGQGAITGGVMGSIGYLFGRNPVASRILGIGGAVGGAMIGMSPDNNSGAEIARQKTEEMFDYYKAEKIDRLQDIAKSKGRTDLMFKITNLKAKTMVGLDYSKQGQEFLMDAYAAMPKADRRFLMDFANAPEGERAEILSSVPDYMKNILSHVWNEDRAEYVNGVNRRSQNMAAMSMKYDMPDDQWGGWSPGVDLNDIKLASVFYGGRDIHKYGYFGSDERDFQRNGGYLEEHAILPYMAENASAAIDLSGDGLLSFVGMPSTIDSSEYVGSFSNDRSGTLSNYVNSSGRF